jgi:hypothetical protein
MKRVQIDFEKPVSTYNTRKKQVLAKFTTDGETAATKLCLELKISQSKLARWMKEWCGPTPVVPTEKETVTSVGQPVAVNDGKPAGKNRVYSINDLKMTGTIVAAGPVVSEIKWDNPTPWGARTCESNLFLRAVGTDPITANERAVFLAASHFVVMDMLRPVSAKKGEPKPPRPEQCKTFADAKKVAGKNKNMMVHAVTAGGNSVPLLRSLWTEYQKIRDIWEREERDETIS